MFGVDVRYVRKLLVGPATPRHTSCQLRRAVWMTGAMRRELETLDESTPNAEVVRVLQKVLNYT